jgi:hypothetical protein
MSDAAADCTAVAYMNMAYVPSGFLQKRPTGSHDCRPFKGPLPGHRTDAQFTLFNFDVAQFLQSIEIHQDSWARQTKIHHGDQALTASERPGGIPVFCHQLERFRQ